MTLLAKFIDSLNVKYSRSAYREVIQPVWLNGMREDLNYVVCLNKGNMVEGKSPDETAVKPNTFWFFPARQPIHVKHGLGNHHEIGVEGFTSDEHRAEFLRTISGLDDFSRMNEVFSIVGFEVQLYDAISFFSVLEMPPFPLPSDQEFYHLIRHICLEAEQNKLGRDVLIKNYMHEMLIHMFRYIESQPYLRKYIDKLNYLTDKRLIDIVQYVQEHLGSDLSNKAIANVAYISEDYVGQFFKSLTNRNLQDYIENQRLEKAMMLLQTEPDTIQEIAHRVGFKDAAYFSRRFKLKYGKNSQNVRSSKAM